MGTHQFIGTVLLAASSIMPMTALADTTPPGTGAAPAAECSFKSHRITSVTPYRVQEGMGRAAVSRPSRLRGANLFVLAEPGLTKEWLQLTLARHLVEMRTSPMKECPLAIEDVTVSVDSAGPGFNVRIVANDTEKAEEVLRRAKLLLP